MTSTSRHRSKTFLYIAAALFVAVVGIQFVRPQLTNPPVTAEIQVPAEVKQVLTTACYDCHSNETKLLWFDRIVPAYWIVADDVRKGRAHLNFSELGGMPMGAQKGALYEALNQMQFGVMPTRNYRSLHPQAEITPDQIDTLKSYLASLEHNSVADSTQITAADEQYKKWIDAGDKPVEVRPSPNGIEFQHDYKNWKTISSTERYDNQTIRAILGNDTAVKAIADNHINPWPDGTSFAKVAWNQLADDTGVVRAGQFIQVEFMIKDKKKYASTGGWGWARWVGTDLQPYGKNADFSSECIGCHTPMRHNDLVFTLPIKGQR